MENERKEILIWNPIRGKMKENPETIFICSNSHRSMFHPNFINHGKAKCFMKNCNDKQQVLVELCKFRGWKFKGFDEGDNRKRVFKFLCNYGHLSSMKCENFRLGSNCKKCNNFKNDKMQPTCDCEFLRMGFRTTNVWICEHYNHSVLYSDSASEWDFDNPLNLGITPDKLSPSSAKKYWFKCKNCDMKYEQTLSHRVEGNRCPYCCNQKICEKNCLANTDPDLLKEWDFENNIVKPTEISRGSGKKIWWICRKHKKNEKDIPFRWKTALSNRTTPLLKTGCPMCSVDGPQKLGGNLYFLEVANRVHNNFYEYPEEYVLNTVKINIKCPKHGIFKQTPDNHKAGHGCRICFEEKSESKAITSLKQILIELGIKYEQEKYFEGLKYKDPLRVDLYLTDYKLCIEYDGGQHFKPVPLFGGEKGFNKTRIRDLTKDLYCVKNGYSLLRIPYNANISKELILLVIDKCRTTQIYCSYVLFMHKIVESLSDTNLDLSKIIALAVAMP